MSTQIIKVAKTCPKLDQSSLKRLLRASIHDELVEVQYMISPDMAKYILDNHNKTNRSLNANHKSSLARDMKAGNWLPATGASITFDSNGSLVNGQHRLTGIVDSGITCRMSIKFGCNPKSRLVEDSGRRRGPADVMTSMEGKQAKQRFERASVARMIYGFKIDPEHPHTASINHKPTQTELYKAYTDHREAINESVDFALQHGLVGVTIVSYAAFLRLLMKQSAHADKVDGFFEKLASGANLNIDDPIMVVRNRLTMRKDEFRNQKHKDKTLGMMVKGWNHYVAGKPMTTKTHTPNCMLRINGLDAFDGIPIYEGITSDMFK
jgi:hypothetical protein